MERNLHVPITSKLLHIQILFVMVVSIAVRSCANAIFRDVRKTSAVVHKLSIASIGSMRHSHHAISKTAPSVRKLDTAALQTRGGSSSSNPPQWRRAYLGIGSNMGHPFQNMADALTRLQSTGRVRLVRTSFLRKTSPMYVTDQPDFLNGAIEIETVLSPLELLRELKQVEGDMGRDLSPNAVRNGPRPIDLDILLFDGYEVQTSDGTAADTMSDNEIVPNGCVMKNDVLEIPHKCISERAFVLEPLTDLNKRIIHPTLNKTMDELLMVLQGKSGSVSNDERSCRVLPLPRGRMLVFNQTIIMGILNVTPDSFSDGGRYSESVEVAVAEAMQMRKDGAMIVDVGGESTRPGAEEVGVDEEMRRVLPVISRIREECQEIIISIDTRHSSVARAAIEAGADIVNDVSGGTHDPQMLSCVADMGVPIILMHMRGNPKTMQSLTNYSNSDGVVAGVSNDLNQRSTAAEAAGIHRWMQVLDPGIGFAKELDDNLSLLKGAGTLRKRCDNLPFLFGPSRKGFIGKISGEEDASKRDYGTIAACLATLQNSGDEACTILRVHNVKAMKQAVMIFDAIKNAS